eukprot:10625860-Alexandrium_andersonii.AAC.1
MEEKQVPRRPGSTQVRLAFLARGQRKGKEQKTHQSLPSACPRCVRSRARSWIWDRSWGGSGFGA